MENKNITNIQRAEDIKKAYSLFHHLWGEAKDGTTGNYVKNDWSELYVLLMKIIDKKPFKI